MNPLKERILNQLMDHLEEMDANELRPKPPEGMEMEGMSVDVEPKDELMAKANAGGSDKGPMEKLMAGEDQGKEDGDDEELSDEEMEELAKQYS